MKHFKLFALLLCCLATDAAWAKAAEPVYIYGMATSLMDSVVYVTPIQQVQGAKLEDKTGFLADRSHYTEQFHTYLVAQGLPQSITCAVVFHTSKAKLSKRLAQLRDRVGKAKKMKHLSLQELPAEGFQFTPYQAAADTIQ